MRESNNFRLDHLKRRRKNILTIYGVSGLVLSRRLHQFAHLLSAYCIRVIYACAQTRSKFKFEKVDVGKMPTPYSIDLPWRVVWFDLVHGFASHEIADLFCLSERTV